MRSKNLMLVAAVLAVAALFAVTATAQMAKPEMVTLSGVVMDLTCAAKGKAMMGNWYNAENNDHKTPDGPKPGCAEMCLKGGQPAGLFNADKGKIIATLGCNPRTTLANFAAQEVELMGFWGDKGNVFIPGKIRKGGGGDWQEVDCMTMH